MATPAPGIAYGMNFRLTLDSAENLVNVRKLGKLKVYAKVSLDELPATVMKTNPDRERRSNPRWSFTVDYMISQEVLQRHPEVEIVVELKCERSLGENRKVGRVRIGVRELFEMGRRSENVLSCPVEGCPDGRLNFSYSFGELGYFVLPGGNETASNHIQYARPGALDVAQGLIRAAPVIVNGTMILLSI